MLDVLAIGAHPDDCEIIMSGTICVLKELGYKVGVCDLCQGESGTYGSAEIRRSEAHKASEILQLDARIILDMPDGNIRNTEENRMKLIEVIRAHRPSVVFGFHPELVRHPDHYHAGELVKECTFLAGLEKLRTQSPPHRPTTLITFKQLLFRDKADFVVDISAHWERKIAAIRAFASQVAAEGEDDTNSKTFIRSHAFWDAIETRARMAGSLIGAKYGEMFYCDAPPKLTDIPAAFQR